MRQKRLFSSLIALSLGATAGVAHAAPTLRTQVDQKGDFVMFGNTLGFECDDRVSVGVPAPTLGTVSCPNNVNSDVVQDSAPDIFWRSDEPAAGQATASTTITAAQARSTAVLDIPAGATITHARLYWAGLLNGLMSTDPTVSILPPGAASATVVTADEQFFIARNPNRWYQSTADITSLLVASGEGAYRVSDVGSVALHNVEDNDPMAAWVVVVLYSLPTDPPRNLTIFDGLDLVSSGNPAAVSLSGFRVPNAGFDAKLGVITYEGEFQYSGDALSFNGTALSNATNPVNNFFNGTRTTLGTAVSNVGDLPQLTGGPASMSGVDIDVVDVKAELAAGDTSADITASSSLDTYLLGAFVTSISTFKPDFSTSGKSFTDVNGGVLLPGDILEYTITVTNTGNDASVNTIMTDDLPVGVTYVPGSISVTSGPGMGGPFTDVADTDAGEYVAGSRRVRVRVGNTPFAASNGGGRMAVNATAVIKFRVTIDATASGSLFNQAIVTASGEQGAPADDFPTDGNGNGSGVPPTETIVDKCATNAQCAAPTPACDTAPTPNVCVECVLASDCTNPAEPQCLPDHTCGCTVGCDDTDGDGLSDATEGTIGTNPDDADSDDDGVKDGDEPSFADDTDGDGTINALDPDSDDDGLYDGTELGLPCDGAGTAPGSTHCIADGDAGTTKTDPLDADTDDGGVRDGSEDVDHDGEQDATETDPTAGNGADDGSLDDTDGDGLTDDEEDAIGTDPMDGDSDDDGVIDGDEVNPSDDADGDGLINALDPDSDNDGLYDGTELGLDCGDAATDITKMHCRADVDPDTVTNPVDADTDDGGVDDGSEDFNRDGAQDAGETDPTAGHGADDGTLDDDDGDGLTNGVEDSIGTESDDADSDDDGVKDGDEPNFADDTDNDGNINALDTDSDDDGLLDGTELGKDCMDPATDAAAAMCVADADDGATTTNPLDADTDNGSVSDGDEDEDHDGEVDPGERDPNDGSDDVVGGEGGAGGEAGAGTGGSTMAGTAGAMVAAGEGGLMSGGNSATGGSAGASAGNLGTGNVGNSASVDGILEGGGCACRTTAPASSQAPLTALVSILGLVGVAVARRRRRQG
jgi:clumping factor A